MDEGPFRMPRQADRRTSTTRRTAAPAPTSPLQTLPPETSAPEQKPRQTPPSRTARVQPTKVETESRPAGSRPVSFWVATALAVVLLALVGWYAWSSKSGGAAATGIDASKYQAVFLANGNIYFGKLNVLNDNYLKLTNIYYIKNQQPTEDAAAAEQSKDDQNKIQLIKLGEEIHNPEDEMFISKDQVLYYENLKSDGKFSQTIKNYKANK